MSFDFSALLVLLVLISGAIWAFDRWVLAPRRRRQEGDEAPASTLVEYARSFFPIFLIVLILRSFLVEPFRIPSASMMPSLLIGDFIVVNKYVYGIRIPVINRKVIDIGAPERGDVIVFRYPKDPSTPYIKRVVGVPGDHVIYRDKELIINGERISREPSGRYRGHGKGSQYTGARVLRERFDSEAHRILLDDHRNYGRDVDIVVPEGHYFVLGDNRDNSKDSRFWGMVPDRNLIGEAFMIWMNWDGGIDWSRIGEPI